MEINFKKLWLNNIKVTLIYKDQGFLSEELKAALH